MKPDAVIAVYNDHGNHFFFDNYPTFALGVGERHALADEGRGRRPFPDLDGHPDLAWFLAERLIVDEFDLSVCQELKVDHGILAPLPLLFETPWPVPLIPLEVNVLRHPLPTVQRCYKLGKAIGVLSMPIPRRSESSSWAPEACPMSCKGPTLGVSSRSGTWTSWFCNGLYRHTVAGPHIMQQATIRSLAKAEFMMALAFTIAKSTNVDVHLHVQGMLSEMIVATELVRACLDAAESQATQTRFGTFAPATLPLWVVRLQFPKHFVRMQEIIQLLGAGGLVAVPSYAETASAVQAHVLTYFQAANVDAPSRIKLFRLAFDAAVSSFAGRQQLYERYYAGDPVRLAGALYNLYGKDEHMELGDAR